MRWKEGGDVLSIQQIDREHHLLNDGEEMLPGEIATKYGHNLTKYGHSI